MTGKRQLDGQKRDRSILNYETQELTSLEKRERRRALVMMWRERAREDPKKARRCDSEESTYTVRFMHVRATSEKFWFWSKEVS